METLIEKDTAGSPVEPGIRWTNRPVAELAEQLQSQGFEIGVDALRRVLFDELELSRRQAFKDEAACRYEHRDEQFQHIARLRDEYAAHAWPILSIDTKKKEILGNFFHPGRAITDGLVRVNDHDFVTAENRLVPYGVYDVLENEGFLYLARDLILDIQVAHYPPGCSKYNPIEHPLFCPELNYTAKWVNLL